VITIKKSTNETSLRGQVEKLSGIDTSACLQCKKCSNGCSVSKIAATRPSEVMRLLHLGAGNELLDKDLVWLCVSCETCTQRCPMGIDVAGVIDALRKLSQKKGAKKPEGNMPLFNKAFLKTVEVFGRPYDMGMIAAYKIGTGKLMNDTDKFPAMLKKGKLSLLPARNINCETIRRIFKKAQESREKSS